VTSFCRRSFLIVIAAAACAAAPCQVDRTGWRGERVIDTAVDRLCKAVKIPVRLVRSTPFRPGIGEEGYAFEPGGVIVANSARGALYGAYAFAEYVEHHGRTPDPLVSKPRFPYREWQTAALQGNFNLPLGGGFDRPLEEMAGVVRRTIHEAPRYGINTLQLMGRVGEGVDVSWFVEYDAFPKLRARRPIGWSVERRIDELRRLADEAHRYGLDLLIWDHEIAFPPGFVEVYPEVRGVDYPICFSHPFVLEFVDKKFDEFFRNVPEIDGIDLTFAETRGYNLLEHGGCKCDRCSRTSTEEKLQSVILRVRDACRRHGKRMEVRSYNQSARHAAIMRKVMSKLPPDLVIVTKASIVDFRGVSYPDDPMLGGFPGQPQTLELTATPEGSGYGYIPALLPDFFKAKISAAAQKKLAGVAIRTDYHLQFGHSTFFTDGPPVLTFDTPNDLNVYASSRLAWDPSLPVDYLWHEWANARYGKEAARAIRALKRTAAISEGIFFVRGFSLLTHLNMVPHLATIDDELKNSYLLEFFPENADYRRTYEQLTAPTEEVIREVLTEKQRAIDEARLARSETASIESLDRWLRTAEDAARLWKQIAAVYFRLRQRPLVDEKLDESIDALLSEAYRIEQQSGRVWPIFPAARGVHIYEFARQALEAGKNGRAALELWTKLVNGVRPGAPEFYRSFEQPALPGGPSLRFAERSVFVGSMRLPLGRDVNGQTWNAAQPAQIQLIPVGEGKFEIRIRSKS
jgi:hypothetical protein